MTSKLKRLIKPYKDNKQYFVVTAMATEHNTLNP